MTPATRKPLTIEDIRNPARKSGFDHVGVAGGQGSGHGGGKPWMAVLERGQGRTGPSGTSPSGIIVKRGPRRATAEEAAQDYCDYINGGAAVAAKPALKSAGHNGRRKGLPDDPEVEAALGVLRDAKGQAAGKQGFVYCIGEVDELGDAVVGFVAFTSHVKIGYSTNPQARVAELQTGNPRRLWLMAFKQGTVEDEAALHQKYIRHNVLQEWFRPTKELLSEFDLDPATMKPWAAARKATR